MEINLRALAPTVNNINSWLETHCMLHSYSIDIYSIDLVATDFGLQQRYDIRIKIQDASVYTEFVMTFGEAVV